MEINGMNFSIGADPEIFVKDKKGIVSAYGLVKGTKENPFKVDKGAVQVDGMALEFNIDPSYSAEEFKENLKIVQKQLADMIGDLEFTDAVSHIFSEEIFRSQPSEATILGCSPDFNGWTGVENPRPSGSCETQRTVGGHIHIGGFESENPYSKDHFDLCAKLARVLDEQLGVYSILWDLDDDRRSMYGKAGSFRPKTYGMEYRTLSSKWVFNDKLVDFVYNSVERALKLMFNLDYEPSKNVQYIIDNSVRNSIFFSGNERVKELKSIMGV